MGVYRKINYVHAMEIYFDGYCPKSLLKSKKVEMRLNEDDFSESEATVNKIFSRLKQICDGD